MAKWFENNMSAVREYPFDFERYMEQRLREIDNLDERRFMKEILLQGLGSAVQFMESWRGASMTNMNRAPTSMRR